MIKYIKLVIKYKNSLANLENILSQQHNECKI